MSLRQLALGSLATAMALTASAGSAPPPNTVALSRAAPIAIKNGNPFGGAERGNWRVAVDARAFRLIAGSDARVLDRPAIGNRVRVALPGRAPAVLSIDAVSETVPGVTTISGALIDEANGRFNLSIHNERITGQIRDARYNWVIEPDGSTHRLRQVERALIPRISDDMPELADARKSAKKGDGPALAKTGGSGRVDILFLYANNVSNAASLASSIVSEMNTALSNSLVSSNNYVVSAGVQEIDDDFDGDSKSAIVIWMGNRISPFEDLMSDRMFHANADIALLLTDEQGSRLGGAAWPDFDPGAPVAMTTDDYAMGDLTALHEIGHLLNGEHEDHTSSNRGKVANNESWQTVMGGYIECSFVPLPTAPSCERVPYFSSANTSVEYNSEDTGDSTRDMETELESSMVAVSAWRDDGDPTAPDIPGSITRTNEFCNGLHTIDWSTVSGADTYRLYRATNAGFTSPVEIYTGASNGASDTVPSGFTYYYRVRACEDSGCSNYSSQVSANHHSGCS